MRKLYVCLLILLLSLYGSRIFAQLTVTQGAGLHMTPMQLIQSMLVGQGVTISNVTFNGSSDSIISNQIGSFQCLGGAYAQLGLSGGIIISSGTAVGAIGPNNSTDFTGSIPNGPGDPDLSIISNATTWDAAVIEFDFVPSSDTLKFYYVFGSEEFMEYCNQYNDSFGFFLSGPGINGTFSNNSIDIALMPKSSDYVTINNLCNSVPSELWQNPPGAPYFQYDALTYVFTAWSTVQQCQTYHIKIAVADAVDHALDSGVFLGQNSFSATGFTVDNSFSNPSLGEVAIAGCSDANVTFKLQSNATNNDTIRYTIGGTAINGVDYVTIPDSVIIFAGMDSTYITIDPYLDIIPTGIKTVVLGILMQNCSGSNTYYDTIFILPNYALVAHLGNDTTLCQGQSLTLNAQHTGGQAPYTYLWNTGSMLPQITVTPPNGTNLYYVDINDACGAVSRDSIIVTASPKPVITNVNLNSLVCSGSATNIIPQSTVPGSTFSWTVTCNDVNISGYSAGSGMTINQILTNSGTTIDTVTYHVTASASGCLSATPKDFNVVVVPTPDAYFQPNGQSFCSGGTTSISILSHLPGSTFMWTYSLGSFNLGGAVNGSGNLISQTLFNSGFTIDTVTYHIIPSNSGCSGPSFDAKVAVYPNPDSWSVPATQSLCGGSSTSLSLSSDVTGASFSWTAICPSPNVSGYSPGSGTSIVQTISNSGTASAILTYTITTSANGCIGTVPTTILVTVNPNPPVLTSITSYSICSGGTTNIVLQANLPSATFTWTASGSSPNVSGYSSGSGNIISQNLVNLGFNNETVTYSVTPTAFGCVGSTTNVLVTVFPVADVYFTPNGQTICSGTAPSIRLTSHVAGTSFTWTVVGSSGNISGFGPGTGNLISQVLTNSGYQVDSATYTVNPSANSCPGNPNNLVIKVNPLAIVSFIPCNDIITTTDATTITLKGGLPLGGTYSGTGVNAGHFNPGASGTGSKIITYSYTNIYGCANTATLNITVLNPPPFFCNNMVTDVRDNQQYPTVKLGTQCWMAADLNYGTQILSSSMQRDNCTAEKYCLNDNSAKCSSLGGLYQWDELMQFEAVQSTKGLCPPAWHIPSENEWNALFSLYISNGFAGSPLKYSGYSGFDLLLNGIRFDNRTWNFDTFASFIWSSTSQGPNKAWAHAMNSMDPSVSYYPANRSNAFYVRCIKD
ncbi:MAG: choice-of-anchor L domain-containing protein [Bacteroidales bacterium]